MTGIISDNVARTSGLIKAASGGGGGVWTKIKEQTASSSATIDFVHGTSDVVLDATYPVYCFRYINVHPSSDSNEFQVNFSSDSGSNYNVTKTTTIFEAYHNESGTTTGLYLAGSDDLSQSTAFQPLTRSVGNDNDQCACGDLYIFNPASTTFTKHFMGRSVAYIYSDYIFDEHVAGYCNTTSAVNGVQFKFASNNIDSGIIRLYGIKDSA